MPGSRSRGSPGSKSAPSSDPHEAPERTAPRGFVLCSLSSQTADVDRSRVTRNPATGRGREPDRCPHLPVAQRLPKPRYGVRAGRGPVRRRLFAPTARAETPPRFVRFCASVARRALIRTNRWCRDRGMCRLEGAELSGRGGSDIRFRFCERECVGGACVARVVRGGDEGEVGGREGTDRVTCVRGLETRRLGRPDQEDVGHLPTLVPAGPDQQLTGRC